MEGLPFSGAAPRVSVPVLTGRLLRSHGLSLALRTLETGLPEGQVVGGNAGAESVVSRHRRALAAWFCPCPPRHSGVGRFGSAPPQRHEQWRAEPLINEDSFTSLESTSIFRSAGPGGPSRWTAPSPWWWGRDLVAWLPPFVSASWATGSKSLKTWIGPGGRAYVRRQDGFTFDGGPTIITVPFLFEELWALCGRKLADDIDLRLMDPFYRVRFDDGHILTTAVIQNGCVLRLLASVRQTSPALTAS